MKVSMLINWVSTVIWWSLRSARLLTEQTKGLLSNSSDADVLFVFIWFLPDDLWVAYDIIYN